MAINQQYYNYLQFRQNMLKRAYLYHMNICIRIQNIAQHMVAGGAPDDPLVKDDYFYLVSELGEDILREELGRLVVEMKEKPQ